MLAGPMEIPQVATKIIHYLMTFASIFTLSPLTFQSL